MEGRDGGCKSGKDGAWAIGFDVTHYKMVAITDTEIRIAGLSGSGEGGDGGFAAFGQGYGQEEVLRLS